MDNRETIAYRTEIDFFFCFLLLLLLLFFFFCAEGGCGIWERDECRKNISNYTRNYYRHSDCCRKDMIKDKSSMYDLR